MSVAHQILPALRNSLASRSDVSDNDMYISTHTVDRHLSGLRQVKVSLWVHWVKSIVLCRLTIDIQRINITLV